MSGDWWPVPLADLRDQDPWAANDVVVAEVRSFDERPHEGQRRTFSALVPVGEIDAVRQKLAELDHEVSTSGPHPFYDKDRPFNPRFWVEAINLPSKQYEPLVLPWSSHHTTVLQLDPGFLMTYGLVPRPGKAGAVHWDDPQAPRHNIATVSPPSVWDYPLGSHAYVTVAKDALQDYLTLRQMALVQIFWEMRWAAIDADIRAKLGDQEGVNIDFPDRRFQIGRHMVEHGTIFAQVTGARVLAMPADLPISADPLDKEGLVWPGLRKPVTNAVARTLGLGEYVYVDDSVLADFEGRREFDVHPESGSVGHGTQWSVGFSARVGRNVVRVEAKKIYEGVPSHITRHWHRYAVAPVPMSAYPAILDEPNIGTRAKAVVFGVARLGEALARLASEVELPNVEPEEFVGLRRSALEYYGWWKNETTEPTARHVPLGLPVDGFLDRCMSLEKLIIEGLSEGNLRRTLQAMGAPAADIRDWRSLKLLDGIVRLAQLAHATGLSIADDGAELWGRLSTEGTVPAQPIANVFALRDTRLLKAHKASDRSLRLQNELERFGITPGEEAAGYGKILDQIYDRLAAELREATAKIAAVL